MRRERSHQEMQDLEWRPTRIYSSRLEAWPTHYPEWLEAPPQNHTSTWLWKLTLVCVGLAGFLMLF